MPTFKLPCTWQMAGTLYIEADTLEEAKQKAFSDDVGLPDRDYYVDDSFELDEDDDEFGVTY